MSDNSNEYQAVSCDFYDHIEILALRKAWVCLEYSHEGESVIEITRLQTTKTEDIAEYAITEDHREIRMDLLKCITPLNPAIDLRVNLLEKLEYNHWANQKLLEHLKELNDYPSNIELRISHIINAHDIWNRRILQMSQRFGIWELSSPEDWRPLFCHVNIETNKILKQGQLEKMVSYESTKGDLYRSSIADIVFHLINHGTYHRGQISDLLSSSGIEALPTDYILFSRLKSY
ncbi:MAG: putative damage-inducible protein DinB/transcriptional antiterminator Rof (Rho-off) [Saprospiraceae bacterium]|jgi:uncharacterized damage-inducible protein DinB/transcriptional antiterminator Rof (Rho-off)